MVVGVVLAGHSFAFIMVSAGRCPLSSGLAPSSDKQEAPRACLAHGVLQGLYRQARDPFCRSDGVPQGPRGRNKQ